MAKLAIKSHATRGKEVIEILEMLGGKNKYSHFGESESYIFFIRDGVIDCDNEAYPYEFIIFTLEQFREKFPYEVGDKVKVPYEDGRITGNELYEYKILKIKWDNLESTIKYGLPSGDEQRIEYYSTDNLNIWNKKETMEGIIKNDIPKGYEFAVVDDDNQQVVFTKIQPHYPKTYEECCDIFNCTVESLSLETIKNFRHLIYCRNSYWKIAGEQMGLGEPWEPDWDDENEFKYGLYHFRNGIMYDGSCINPTLLAFPTKEMRDAFYENFKDLIEQCRELL